jgi:UDP-N-acetylmuramate dehydrogenase
MDFIQKKKSLSQYTSWLVGGEAEFFCLPKNIEELKSCLQWAQNEKQQVSVLGGGSNVLISDQGVAGLTICMKNFTGVKITSADGAKIFEAEALAGTLKAELLKIFIKHKLAPALFIAGVPGQVGGGVMMNAGVAESFVPQEFGEIVSWFEVLKPDLSLKIYKHNEVEWSYRHCQGWQPGVITRVGIRWDGDADPALLEKVKTANHVRLSKQPLDMPSCGSVFKNPPGMKAAQLIDSCGLKGFKIGGAQVSTKHANFIVNTGGAKASEIWQVILHVQETVKFEKAVELSTEVVRLGLWS